MSQHVAHRASDEIAQLNLEIERLTAGNERLREALNEAADAIQAWGAYASDYMQDKHDLAGDIARTRAAAEPPQLKER
jgi:ABC-type transporter Mla subunit MlaD